MRCTDPGWGALILPWLEEGLSPEEASRVEAHVRACPACQEEAESLRELAGTVASAFRVQKASPLAGLCPPPADLVDYVAAIRAGDAGSGQAVFPSALDARTMHMIAEHLQVCPSCADEVAALLAFEVEVEVAPVPPSESVALPISLAVRRAFEEEFGKPRAGRLSPSRDGGVQGGWDRVARWTASARRPLGAVATIAVIFGVSWLFVHSPDMVFAPVPPAPEVVTSPHRDKGGAETGGGRPEPAGKAVPGPASTPGPGSILRERATVPKDDSRSEAPRRPAPEEGRAPAPAPGEIPTGDAPRVRPPAPIPGAPAATGGSSDRVAATDGRRGASGGGEPAPPVVSRPREDKGAGPGASAPSQPSAARPAPPALPAPAVTPAGPPPARPSLTGVAPKAAPPADAILRKSETTLATAPRPAPATAPVAKSAPPATKSGPAPATAPVAKSMPPATKSGPAPAKGWPWEGEGAEPEGRVGGRDGYVQSVPTGGAGPGAVGQGGSPSRRVAGAPSAAPSEAGPASRPTGSARPPAPVVLAQGREILTNAPMPTRSSHAENANRAPGGGLPPAAQIPPPSAPREASKSTTVEPSRPSASRVLQGRPSLEARARQAVAGVLGSGAFTVTVTIQPSPTRGGDRGRCVRVLVVVPRGTGSQERERVRSAVRGALQLDASWGDGVVVSSP